MKRWFCLSTATLVGLFGATRPALAQNGAIGSYAAPQINNRPAVSPYLNMNRSGNPAINYYGLVRPQIDTSRNLQALQQDVQQLQTQQTQVMDPRADGVDMIDTGHQVSFLNTGVYFSRYSRNGNNGGAGGAGGARIGGASGAGMPPPFGGAGGNGGGGGVRR